MLWANEGPVEDPFMRERVATLAALRMKHVQKTSLELSYIVTSVFETSVVLKHVFLGLLLLFLIHNGQVSHLAWTVGSLLAGCAWIDTRPDWQCP